MLKLKRVVSANIVKKRLKKSSVRKGCEKVSFDVKSHTVNVRYDESKTTIRNIQVAITKLGYDADSLLADPKAYEKLNACCKNQISLFACK